MRIAGLSDAAGFDRDAAIRQEKFLLDVKKRLLLRAYVENSADVSLDGFRFYGV